MGNWDEIVRGIGRKRYIVGGADSSGIWVCEVGGRTMFKPRLIRPEQGNKYYITKGAGGFSRAIVGKPTDKWCNVLSNCVGYAYGRFHEIAQRTQCDYFDPINAEDIYENAQRHGLKTGQEPCLGAAMVWEGIGSAAGHVAIVEQLNSDGSITTSESGWNCSNPFWTQKRQFCDGNWDSNKSAYRFKGFVYQPDKVEPSPINPPKVLKEGDISGDVIELQSLLAARGYLRSNEIDGDFGKITKGAVTCFQLENGLEVDGICGPQTQAKLGLKI